MGFSKTAEYALRAMVHLARAPGAVTAEALSGTTQVPGPYLSKILRQLTRAGLVHAVRGKNGGCRLSPAGREATVYVVVQAVDPLCRVRSCPLGIPDHDGRLCPLHAAIDAAFAQLETSFKSSRVVDLVECEMPKEGWLTPAESGAGKVLTAQDGRSANVSPGPSVSSLGSCSCS